MLSTKINTRSKNSLKWEFIVKIYLISHITKECKGNLERYKSMIVGRDYDIGGGLGGTTLRHYSPARSCLTWCSVRSNLCSKDLTLFSRVDTSPERLNERLTGLAVKNNNFNFDVFLSLILYIFLILCLKCRLSGRVEMVL